MKAILMLFLPVLIHAMDDSDITWRENIGKYKDHKRTFYMQKSQNVRFVCAFLRLRCAFCYWAETANGQEIMTYTEQAVKERYNALKDEYKKKASKVEKE